MQQVLERIDAPEGFIFDPSLVLYLPLYRLDGASFMSRDAYGHLCTVTGAVWTLQGRILDGDDYISGGTSSTLDLGTDDFEIEFWLRGDTIPLDYSQVIGKANQGVTALTVGWVITAQKAGSLNIYFAHNATANKVGWPGLSPYMQDDTWRFFCFSGNRGVGTLELFFDLVSKGVKTPANFTDNVTTTVELRIGRAFLSAHWLKGYIGELLMYKRLFNPLERQHNYLATKWRYQ